MRLLFRVFFRERPVTLHGFPRGSAAAITGNMSWERSLFLNLLNDRQQRTFLAMATKLLLADGRFTLQEEAALETRVLEMGGEVRAPHSQVTGAPDLQVFDTRRSRTVVVMELYILMMADDHAHAAEEALMSQWLTAFSITPEKADRLRAWAAMAAPVAVEALALLKDDRG